MSPHTPCHREPFSERFIKYRSRFPSPQRTAREGAEPRGRLVKGLEKGRSSHAGREAGREPVDAPAPVPPHARSRGSPCASPGSGRAGAGALPGRGGGCWHSDACSEVPGAVLSAPLLSPLLLTASCSEPPHACGDGRHSPSVTALPLGRLPRSTAGPSRKIVSSPPETTLPLFSVCRSRVSCLFSTVGDEGTWRKRPSSHHSGC